MDFDLFGNWLWNVPKNIWEDQIIFQVDLGKFRKLKNLGNFYKVHCELLLNLAGDTKILV